MSDTNVATPSEERPHVDENGYYYRYSKYAGRNIKGNMQGCSMLGSDGVLRNFDGHYDRNVVDYVCLSPTQIKEMLDRSPMPWSQELEDKWRGVDGRTVVEHERLWNPPYEDRPTRYTEEDKIRVKKEVDEANRKTRERIAQEERDGVDVKAKYACGRKNNDYDLSPREKT